MVHRGRQAFRPTVAVAAFVVSVLIGGVVFARSTPPLTTISDIAIVELYTDLASHGRLLVGPYSRFGWHHPGPLYFYLQAPLYVLSGHRASALYAGALGINLGAMILLAFVISRENRGAVLVLLTTAAVVFAWRAPRLLASPWTAHVPVLLTVSFVALCAVTASRRPQFLPLALAVGTFVVQTHVGFAPVVAILTTATVAVLFARRHDRDRVTKPTVITAVAVCLLLWLIPILESVLHSGGNVAALWQFFVSGGGQGHTSGEAVRAWSYGLTAAFRANFVLPWGGHFVAPDSFWIPVWSSLEVLLLAAIGFIDLNAGRRFEGNLAIASFLASVTGLWALTRVRDDILDHEILWLAAFGFVDTALIAAFAARVFLGTLTRTNPHERVALTMTTVTLVVALGVGAADLRRGAAYELTRLDRPRIVAAHAAIRGYLKDRGIQKPLISIDAAVWSQAAGVLVKLQREGTTFALPVDVQWIFTEAFAPTGTEDAQISIASRTLHNQLVSRRDNTVVLEADPVYIDAISVPPMHVR